MSILDDVILEPDTRANQPAATAVSRGAIYCVTDEGDILERSNGTTWDPYSPAAGAGDVVGPASATDENVAVYDSTTGKLIKDGGQTIAQIIAAASGGGGDWPFFEQACIIVQRITSTAGFEAIGAQVTITGTGAGGTSLQYDAVLPKQSYSQFLSAASAGSQIGIVSAFSWVTRDMEPIFDFIVRAPDVLTTVRMWVGFFPSTPSNSDDPPNHSAGFRFSSVAGDTGWRPITRDTATNAGTNIGTVTAGQMYWLRIRCVSGHVYFSVDGGTEQDVTSNLPTGTTLWGICVTGYPTASSARSLGVARGRVLYGGLAPGA